MTNSAMAMFGYTACVAVPSTPAAKKKKAAGSAAQSAPAGRTAADLPKPLGQPPYKSEIGRRIFDVVGRNKIKFQAPAGYTPASEKFMETVAADCDVLVAGGGLSGISAALAAARNGAKVLLVQNRSRLGGNSSSEIKMHPLGIREGGTGYREAGIIEELKLEDISQNVQRSWEMWDLMLYDKIISNPNITLLLDTAVFSAETDGDTVKTVYARSDLTLKIFKISAKYFIDCTGDGRLAMEAGAEMMWGRDGSKKYGESLAGDKDLGGTLCSSILFTTMDVGRPVPYKAPAWAHKITAADLRLRNPQRIGFQYGYYFVAHGGLADTVHDDEVIRFELLSVVLGLWDYLKNCGKYPETANLALDTVGMIPARRESFRIKGLKLFTQSDIYGGWRNYPDQVASCGWVPEDQPSGGIFAPDEKPAMNSHFTPTYNMPLSVLISKDFKNLCMAGRNMSCSHLAFSCTRVMCTGSVMGQAIGTAAALAVKSGRNIADYTKDAALITALQQRLLRDGQLLIGVENLDAADLAKKAAITATSSAFDTLPSAVANGRIYDLRRENKNKWIAALSESPELQLTWDIPQKISALILNFDSGCRHLCITKEGSRRRQVLEAPQPEILKDYDIVAVLADGSRKTVARRRGNYQKRVVENFDTVAAKSLILKPLASNGDKFARVFEIRAYSKLEI